MRAIDAYEKGISSDAWQVRRHLDIVQSVASNEPLKSIGERYGITGARVRQVSQNARRYYQQAKIGKRTLDGSWQSRVAMALIQTNSTAVKAWLDQTDG